VLIGFGWTGAIMGMELTEAGLNVVASKGVRTVILSDFAYPRIADELTYAYATSCFRIWRAKR